MRVMKKRYFLPLVLPLFWACGNQQDRHGNPTADALFMEQDSVLMDVSEYSDTVTIRYARGLTVEYLGDSIRISIQNPDASARRSQPQQIMLPRNSEAQRNTFLCTTALQLGNFEVLGLEDRIVGINSLRNLFSPRMKEQLSSGHTTRVGKEGNFDLETILALQPSYIFVSASKHGGFEALRDCGIPLITHHGYKEQHPLGQAEWIKLVGLLTGEPRRANAVFSSIERKYMTLQQEVAALDSLSRPTVVSGRQLRDGWYIVGGRSYMAQLFRDAGARYVMDDNEDTGGTTLDFEAVYARGVDADFWQTDGSFDGEFTLQHLASEDPRYATMRAFGQHHVLFCNLAHTPYRELAGVQPHLLLADFVKAFHPELLPHYTPRYYQLLCDK